jgi:hypothetical protein
MPRKLILGFVLAWGAFALLQETGRALAGVDARDRDRQAVPYWRLGTPQVARLDRCLDLVRRRVPSGSVVAFASPPDGAGEARHEFFRWRWAAYLLPEYEIAPLAGPDTGRLAEYLVTYHRDLDNPRLQPLAAAPDCRLYRVTPVTGVMRATKVAP